MLGLSESDRKKEKDEVLALRKALGERENVSGLRQEWERERCWRKRSRSRRLGRREATK